MTENKSELMQAIDWIDDFIARCNGDDRGSCDSVNLVRAALANVEQGEPVMFVSPKQMPPNGISLYHPYRLKAEGNFTMPLFTHPAPTVEQGEPVAWWIPKAEQFCIQSKDGGRPFLKDWQPLYAHPVRPMSDEQATDGFCDSPMQPQVLTAYDIWITAVRWTEAFHHLT